LDIGSDGLSGGRLENPVVKPIARSRYLMRGNEISSAVPWAG